MNDAATNDPNAREAQSFAERLVRFTLASARRHLPLILVTTVLGAALGAYVLMLRPNEYGSNGKLYIRPGVREVLTPESAIADTVQNRVSTREILLNELQILATPEVFERAALAAGLDTVLTPAERAEDEDGWRGALRGYALMVKDWIESEAPEQEEPSEAERLEVASTILKMLAEIKPAIGANVITVSYSSDTPEKAQRIVDALLASAVEVHVKIMDSMGAADAIQQELEEAEDRARKADLELRDFLREKQVYNFDAQQGGLVTYLSELLQALDSLQTSEMRTRAEVDHLRSIKANVLPTREVEGSANYVVNPDIAPLTSTAEALRLRKIDLESQRIELEDKEYQKRLRAIETLEDDVQKRLDSSKTQIKLPGAMEENPVYASIMSGLQSREVNIKGLARERAELLKIKDATEQRLAELAVMYPRKRELELLATKTRANADRLSTTLTSMRALQRLEKLKMSNLQIMHPATYEPEPISSRRTSKFLACAVAGGLLGVGVALLLGLRNRKVRDRSDLLWIGADPERVIEDAGARRWRHAAWGRERLPPKLAPSGDAIATTFAAVHYDPRSEVGLSLAAVPCDQAADGSRAAGYLACGLSVLGGKRVVYVSCTDDDGWLAQSLAVTASFGWRDVVAERAKLEDAVIVTTIEGLDYLPFGVRQEGDDRSVSLAGDHLLRIIEQLRSKYDFVVIEFPSIDQQPEVATALRSVDAALLAARARRTKRAAVRHATAVVDAASAQLVGISLQSGRA